MKMTVTCFCDIICLHIAKERNMKLREIYIRCKNLSLTPKTAKKSQRP